MPSRAPAWYALLLTRARAPAVAPMRSDLTALIVTHDRAFLSATCDEVLELEAAATYRHRGSYEAFLDAKQARLEADGKQAQAARNKLRVELDWVRRQPKVCWRVRHGPAAHCRRARAAATRAAATRAAATRSIASRAVATHSASCACRHERVTGSRPRASVLARDCVPTQTIAQGQP